MALAKGARQNGATIIEGVKVTAVNQKDGRVTSVTCEQEGETYTIETENVVNAAGMWGRTLANMSGVTVPLHACEHFYIVTEPIPGLKQLPVLRVPDECTYYKEDAGKMLETAGIHTFFNGPESFTPDDRYYLGEAPELKGYWVAAGYNSIGIVSSGGAGMALAQWMNDGEPPFDLWEVDIRRAQPFQKNRAYLKERVSETLGLLYADHFPYRQMATARGVRRSPLHEHLKTRGAVFGEVAGNERANWFARDGQEREYEYSWHRQNWFENQKDEHLAVRNNVGLFDMSSFGKIRVEGRDACAFLNRLCANQMDVKPGRIVYTQMLNHKGGIESDLTVTRLSEDAFFLVVPGATLQRDLAWLRKNLTSDEFVVITDVTAGEAVLCVMGPKSRELMRQVSPNDFSNANHPFATAREIEVGMGLARAHRVTYVGELGWELYVSSDQAAHVFEALEEAGADVGLKLCGLHTLDSCRIEKAFRHFGHDITDEDHVLEAGLGFAVRLNKQDFIGREAVLRKQEAGLKRRMLQFKLDDPEPLLFHNEAIVRDGKIVSIVTSGNYGHYLGGAIGLGYVPCEGQSEADVLGSKYEIEIAGTRVSASASIAPMYDPKSERVRA
jgi:glycine cleavage system T protein